MRFPTITHFQAFLVALISLTLAVTLTAVEPVVNGSFESPVVVDLSGYGLSPTTDSWTLTSGAQVGAPGNVYGTPPAPNGDQVLIMQQGAASATQSLTLNVGQYAVVFQAARRTGQIQPLLIQIDGVNVGVPITAASDAFASYRSAPFTITATGSHTLALKNINLGGDRSIFVDAVSIVPDNSPTPTLTTVVNGSFETPAGADWVFLNSAGIEQNGGPYGVASAPDGTHAAYLQGNGSLGSMSLSVNLTAGVTYAVRFKAAQRPTSAAQQVQIRIDGTPVGIPIAPRGTGFEEYVTDSFVVATTGPHILAMAAVDASGDKTAFIDLVRLETVDRFWVGGTDANWSTAANWASTSGGSDSVTAPDARSAVTFDGSAACTLDVDATVGSLTFTGACTATVTFGAGKTLSVTRDADLRSGAGTPFAGTGTLAMSGSAAHTLTPPAAGKPLPALRLAGPGVTTLSGNPLVCTGALTLESGTIFDWGAQTSVRAGSVVVDGAIAAYDSRSAFVNATGAQTVHTFTGAEVNTSGSTLDIGGGSSVPFGATVTVSYLRVVTWLGGPQMPALLLRYAPPDYSNANENISISTLTPSAGVSGFGFDLCSAGFPFTRAVVYASDGTTQNFDFAPPLLTDDTTYPMFRGFRAPAGTTITKIEFPQNDVPELGFGSCWLDNLTLAPANTTLALTIPAGKTLTTTGSGTTLTVPSGVMLVNQGTLSLSGTTFAAVGSTDFATNANTVVYNRQPIRFDGG